MTNGELIPYSRENQELIEKQVARIRTFEQGLVGDYKDRGKRRIEEFHDWLIGGDIHALFPRAIEEAARVEAKFGYVSCAEELLTHPAYVEGSFDIRMEPSARIRAA